MIMRIGELREQAGLTQRELGQRMNVLQSAVSSWETEISLPKARDIPRLAQVLGCTIDALFCDADNPDARQDSA